MTVGRPARPHQTKKKGNEKMRTDDVWNEMESAVSADITDSYARIASSYDRVVEEVGYVGPQRCADLAVQTFGSKETPVADFGAGTGLGGAALASCGFTEIYGFDCTPEMLTHADRREVYRRTFVSDLGDLQEYAHLGIGNAIACGLFTPGHADPALLLNICSLLPAGGRLILTVNDWARRDASYSLKLERALSNSEFIIEQSVYDQHCTERDLHSEAIVLRKQ